MVIKNDKEEIQSFLTDASNFKGECDAVYFPENAEEVKEILIRTLAENKRVTVAGNGTGLTGARVPKEGIVISTEKLNRIIEINEKEFYAFVEPGVILSDLQGRLDELNLFYPPDPTETNCFIGGTVAANASGAKTFKYGPTRNYIAELEIILPDGETLNLKRGFVKADGLKLSLKSESGKEYNLMLPDFKMPDVKNASGFFIKPDMDAIDLFIGSEGSLGVITKIKLKLLAKPGAIISCVVFFEDENRGLDFIEEGRTVSFKNKNQENKIEARALEYFDDNSLRFLAPDFPNIPEGAKAAVWFEQEAGEENEDELLEQWIEIIQKCGGNEELVWFAVNEKDREDIHKFRHAISLKVNEYIARNNYRKLGTDVAVPDDQFREFFFWCGKTVRDENIDYVAYGHFGNSHIHLNMLPDSQDKFEKGKYLYKKICQKAVELKGTISAEHGVGKIKADYLIEMYGEEVVRQMGRVKKVFDPQLILGIGNVVREDLL
jgi:D-lactate dehydrogenase (cytochrome)